MLHLESNLWGELTHAYGKAVNIPQLLKQLKKLPPSDGTSEP